MRLTLLGELRLMTGDLVVEFLHLRPWRTRPGEDDDVGVGFVNVFLSHADSPRSRQVVAALDGDRLPTCPSRGNGQRRDEHRPRADLHDGELAMPDFHLLDVPCWLLDISTLVDAVYVCLDRVFGIFEKHPPGALFDSDLLDLGDFESRGLSLRRVPDIVLLEELGIQLLLVLLPDPR